MRSVMRLILTIAISALVLSGCVANWPSNRTGPRWTGGPPGSFNDNGGLPPNNPDPIGVIHGF